MRILPIILSDEMTAKFWLHTIQRGPDDCWERPHKLRGLATHPYSHIPTYIDGRKTEVKAHRYSYALHNGSMPPELVVDHLCSNTICVNPAHLEAITQLENVRRGAAKITHCKRDHEYTPENTRIQTTPYGRMCITCQRLFGRAYRLGLKLDDYMLTDHYKKHGEGPMH